MDAQLLICEARLELQLQVGGRHREPPSPGIANAAARARPVRQRLDAHVGGGQRPRRAVGGNERARAERIRRPVSAAQQIDHELAAVLEGCDGRWSPLIRKRVARHVDKCEVCAETKKRTFSPAQLLSAIFPGTSRAAATTETEKLRSTVGRFCGPDFFDSLVRRPQVPVLTVLLKKSALTKSGLFEETKPYHGGEDYDLWIRLAKAGCVFYGMDAVLARYRRHGTAMTAAASNMFKPMLLVVRRHIDDTGLSELEKRKLLTVLYRQLIAELVDEGKISEAKRFVYELYSCNKKSIVTRLQKLLINIWPRQYNFISRECLYRTEWHLQNSFGRSKPTR